MGKSAPSAPAAPDPNTTAQAQTASNQQTALYNFGLNNPDTYSPLGNLSFTTDTSNPNEPFTTENISLSPAEQQILNQNQSNIIQQGQNAQTAQQNVTGLLNTPYNLQGNVMQTPTQADMQWDLQNDENSIYQQQTQYLDPQFSQEQQQLAAQLVNQGIPQGSAAYNTAMQNFGLQKQQAYGNAANQAVSGGAAYQSQLSNTALQNQAQEAQMYTQQYQEPLSLYSSLMSGTSPTMPQFNALNSSNAAPTNTLAAEQQDLNQQNSVYNSQMGANNSTTSGLFSLGGAGLSAFLPMLFGL